MNPVLAQVYYWASQFSRYCLVAVLALVVGFKMSGISIPLSAQIVIALISLLIGIPHGAIDHLVAIQKEPRSRFFLYIVLYTLIAILSGWGIATWNQNGFQVIVLLSSLHFGFGDASYANEWRDAKGIVRYKKFSEYAYAIPAGLIPVILPLTDSRALSALNRINHSLGGWAGSYTELIRNVTFAFTILGIFILVINRSTTLIVDLLLLTTLATLAPPLITFSLYFGCWHAIRHTARLVPKLASARAAIDKGDSKGAIIFAVVPGLYAVVGTLLIAVLLLFFDPHKFGSGLLWTTLVIVWALTVPHMLTTAKFDRKALFNK